MYLLNFAVNEKITVHLVEEKRTLPRQPVENVGTRRYFYRRQRPDGTEIDDIVSSVHNKHRRTPSGGVTGRGFMPRKSGSP